MRIAKNLSIVFISAFLMFGVALSAVAQIADNSYLTNPGAIRDSDISVDISPLVPGPNQNTKITLTSFATELNKATISWSIDGKVSLSGIGKTSFSFTTGGIGSQSEIAVSIIVSEGSRVDKRITIQPSQVDLLWESVDAYVPAFYKGKALSIKESAVKVVAFPIEKDGTIKPSNKVYNWKKNYVVDQSSSGYGKNTLLVRNSYMNQSDTISVTVSETSGSGSAGTLPINYVEPQILVYEKNPTLGLKLNKLLNDGFALRDGEMSLSAEPFFFSKYKGKVTEKNMEYKWTINGKTITSPTKPNELTIRGNTTPGTANIAISITNINTLFQEAKKTISVTLGK